MTERGARVTKERMSFSGLVFFNVIFGLFSSYVILGRDVVPDPRIHNKAV